MRDRVLWCFASVLGASLAISACSLLETPATDSRGQGRTAKNSNSDEPEMNRDPTWIESPNASDPAGSQKSDSIPVPEAALHDGGAIMDASPAVAGACVAAVYANGDRTCARTTGGTLFCWGASFGAIPRKIRASGTSKEMSIAETFLGPQGIRGRLSDGTQFYLDLRPVKSTTNEPILEATAFSQMALGKWHSCGLKVDGSVWCWGENYVGQLGQRSSLLPETSEVPLLVLGMGNGVAAIGAGDYHTCALKTDGSVWCWGRILVPGEGDRPNYFHHFDSPPGRRAFEPATELSVGRRHACVRLADGRVQCEGFNDAGQTGNGTAITGAPLRPSISLGIANAVQVAAGGELTMAVRSDRSLVAWGLGVLTPGVVTPFGNTVVQVAVGTGHACVRRTDGTAWCWGRNYDGQVGTRGTGVMPEKVDVPCGPVW
jgi:Regulator of chromosome condensation (RCC1) repeat